MISQNASGRFPSNEQIGNTKVTVDFPIEWSGQWQPFVNGLVDLPFCGGIDVPLAIAFSDPNVDTTAHAADPANAVVSQPKASVIFQALVDAMKRLPVMPWDQGE
jgi:hypothetical protein